jgi:hypothetical protein
MSSPDQAQAVNSFNNLWACFSQLHGAMLDMKWSSQLADDARKYYVMQRHWIRPHYSLFDSLFTMVIVHNGDHSQ